MLVPGVRLEINSLHLGPTDHQPSRMGLCWVQRSGVGSSVFRCFFFHGEKLGETVWGRFHQFHGGVFLFGLGGEREEKESQKKGRGLFWVPRKLEEKEQICWKILVGVVIFAEKIPKQNFRKAGKSPKQRTVKFHQSLAPEESTHVFRHRHLHKTNMNIFVPENRPKWPHFRKLQGLRGQQG